MDWFKEWGESVLWIVGFLGVMVGGYEKLVKPIRSIDNKFDTIDGKVESLMKDSGDLIGENLSRAHREWMAAGYCPAREKEKLLEEHARYTELGRNHLAARYREDILSLPDEPAGKEN